MRQGRPSTVTEQYFNSEAGNHYNYFRDYSPEIGRYVESDPIGLRGGINTYSYVSNNPLIFRDSKGLHDQSGTGAEAAGAIHEALQGARWAVKCRGYFCSRRMNATWNQILDWCVSNAGEYMVVCNADCIQLIDDPKYRKECTDKSSCL